MISLIYLKRTFESGLKRVNWGEIVQKTVSKLRREDRRSIECPRCREATRIVPLGNIGAHVCHGCRGLWLNIGEDTALREVASEESLREGVLAVLDQLTAPAEARVSGYLDCPVCSKKMIRRYYKHPSAVVFDRCVEHGAWLDQNDALCLMSLIASGESRGIDELYTKHIDGDLEPRIQHLEGMIRQTGQSVESLDLKRRIHLALGALDIAQA